MGEAVAETLAPIQAKLTELMGDKAQLEAMMKESAGHAQYVAARTLSKARKRLGYLNL